MALIPWVKRVPLEDYVEVVDDASDFAFFVMNPCGVCMCGAQAAVTEATWSTHFNGSGALMELFERFAQQVVATNAI